MILASIHILVLQSKQVKLKYYNRKDLSVKEKNLILCECVVTINYNINLYVVWQETNKLTSHFYV
jgi:hypothetical protein